MPDDRSPNDGSDFEAARAAADSDHYVLQLFVTGSTPRSLRAIANLKEFCETHLPGRYELEVIDLYDEPGQARAHQVVAVPTLIKRLPEPLRRLIGDFSDEEQVLIGLNLKPHDGQASRSGLEPGHEPDDG